MSDPHDTFDLPATDLAVQARRYVAERVPAFIYHHSIRSYLFGRELAAQHGLRPGADYDDELVHLGCVLHDIGLSQEANGNQRFEVDGADLAARFLREHGVEDRRVGVVWDAVALHTSDGIAPRKGAEVGLTQLGVAADILGIQRDLLPAEFAAEVHAAFPREDLGYAIAHLIVAQVLDNPAKASPISFPGHLLGLHRGGGTVPNWYDMIDMAGWGDRPAPDGRELADSRRGRTRRRMTASSA